MFILLPLAAWVALFGAAGRLPLESLRLRVFAASAIWTLCAVAAVEALSPFAAIGRIQVAIFWVLIAAVAWKHADWRWERPKLEWPWLAAGALAALVGLASLASPPNTVDAIVYHAPRVFFWAQHGSVAHYPAYSLTQLLLTPGAEFLSLHFHVLSGSDRFMPLPQFLFYLHAIAAASLLAKYLGANPARQAVAALLAASIPEGVLQASGAKNDFVAAAWILIAACFVFAFRERPRLLFALLTGAAAGLALLAKSTAIPWLPALAVAAAAILRRHPERWRALAAAAALAISINAPTILRYRQFTGHFFAATPEMPGGGCQFVNGSITPGTFFSNAIRNAALHVSTPAEDWNRFAEQTAVQLLNAAGQSPNDPQTTWCATTFSVPPFSFDEIRAPNTLHFALLLIAVPIALRRGGPMRYAALALLSAAAVFCLLLQWQPWHTRLHLAFFVFGTPIAAALLPAWLGAAAFILALPFAFDNEMRPLLGQRSVLTAPREAVYYYGRQMHQHPFQQAVEALKNSGCTRIGIANLLDHYDYPLVAQLKAAVPAAEFQYIQVPNSSKRFPSPMPPPCAVFCSGCGTQPDTWQRFSGIAKGISVFAHAAVFTPNLPELRASATPCRIEFDDRWYPPEFGPAGSWRWSTKGGRLRLSTGTAGPIQVSARLMSLRRPNQVRVLWNGWPAAMIEMGPEHSGAFQFEAATVAGENTFEIVTAVEPVSPPNDPRRLGVGLTGLEVTDHEGALACKQ